MFWGDLATERNLSEGQQVPPSEKNNAGKNAGKAYHYITPPKYVLSLYFSHDLKELDILVRSSAGIILMYYSFAFVMKKYSDHSAFR